MYASTRSVKGMSPTLSLLRTALMASTAVISAAVWPFVRRCRPKSVEPERSTRKLTVSSRSSTKLFT